MFLVWSQPQATATRRVQEAYLAAERPVLRPRSDTSDAEQFLSDLRAVDTEGAPKPVQDAFTRLLGAVEAHLAVFRAGGDTNKANDAVAAAVLDLQFQFDRHSGNPY